VEMTRPSSGNSALSAVTCTRARARASASSSFQPSSSNSTPACAATVRKSSSEIPRNAGRFRMEPSTAERSVAQSASWTTSGVPLPLAKTPSAIWNNVVVFPIPGGATRIRSSRDITAIASAPVVAGSSNPSTLSFNATEVDGHFAVRPKTERSASAAARRRAVNCALPRTAGPRVASLRKTRRHESCSACLFHSRSLSTVNSGSGESTALPWSLHIQTPLLADERSAGDMFGSSADRRARRRKCAQPCRY